MKSIPLWKWLISENLREHLLVKEKYGFENEKIAIKGSMVESCSVWFPYHAKKNWRPYPLCFLRYEGKEVTKSNILLFSPKQHTF